MKKIISKQKQNGEVFTPNELANFLANRMLTYIDLNKKGIRICDPACGDGALLKAISSAMSSKGINSYSIFGSDHDSIYLEIANKSISSLFPNIIKRFELKDFIEERAASLFHSSNKYDIMIGNPPYVRTQTLGNEKAQSISKLYGLSGRVDLYYPFLINMTDSLENGGIIGVITSNRYLTTKSGESIRQYLLNNYDVLEIIDLGDTKLFDAAVLPAIFIGRKNLYRNKSDVGKFYKIYENLSHTEVTSSKSSIYEVLEEGITGCYKVNEISYNFSVGKFIRPTMTTDIWQMNTAEEQSWIDLIHANTAFRVGDKFKVRVGVKSCADEIFLAPNNYASKEKPEDVFFSPMISQENITPWGISDNLLKVIYPHYDNRGKKDVYDIEEYPKAKAFFLKHAERLQKRTYLTKSKRNWYEFWVPQNATLWKYPKLVFPDISAVPRFAIDTTGAIVNGNCYWIYASNEEDLNLLYLIEGVANSNLMVKYHDLCFNNKLYSGRRRYLTQYVEKYPIPDLNCAYSKQIISIAKQLHLGVNNADSKKLITKLNDIVLKAFQLS